MQFPETGGGGEDGKNYLSIKSGETVRGVFSGDLHLFRLHWVNNRGTVCTQDGCNFCKDGNKSSFRFGVNFIIRNPDGSMQARLWEQGWTVYSQLKSLNQDYPLESTVVKVMRTGSGTDTTYTILPDPSIKMTPDLQAKIKAVPLVDGRPALPEPGATEEPGSWG